MSLRHSSNLSKDAIPQDWVELNNLLGKNQFTATPVVTKPEDDENWKYLRPGNVAQNIEELTAAVADENGETSADSRGWIPDKTDAFTLARLLAKGEKESKFIAKGKEVTVPNYNVLENNPACYDACEDIATMTYLNEASVLHNLRCRYSQNLIHTYSGLFLVTVNPWRWLPVYSPRIVMLFRGQNQACMPPHVYAVADNAYRRMIEAKEDQTILITGESGSGKTENTKKIVQYFAVVACSPDCKDEISTLEDRILEANPVLEAFGNAKNIINDNSSRFGKFMKLQFSSTGSVICAEVESYLLEKSRVVSRSAEDRSFHIFYQLLKMDSESKMALRITKDKPEEYKYLSQGILEIEGIDDSFQMEHTEKGLDILGFEKSEKDNLYQMTAACLLMGEMKFRAKSKLDDQAMVEHFGIPDDVCFLLGIESMTLIDMLTQPTVNIQGVEVKQARESNQVIQTVNALAKSVYEKMFRWLVKKCNTSLSGCAKLHADNNFVGILDIAGFEIFGVNGFEQLCINYTNEKLQLVFNDYMFTREQEVYRGEGIDWEYIEFGLDTSLAAEAIEAPMGIISILEEECIAPQGSDDRLAQKLQENLFGKFAAVGKPKYGSSGASKGLNKNVAVAHFSVQHYAGEVNYSVIEWLEKNKDSLNACVITLFKQAKNTMLADIWNYYGTTGFKTNASGSGEGGRQRGRRSSLVFLTVTSVYREQLSSLLRQLNATTPHFVRCIVPNYQRKPGVFDGPLIIHQLKCNGVLEGVRLCRKGFPSRVVYHEFNSRYRLLAPEHASLELEPKKVTDHLCKAANIIPRVEYQLGETKVFCRTGVLGRLENLRTAKWTQAIVGLQANIRWHLIQRARHEDQVLENETRILQKNVRYWVKLMNWSWFRLVKKIKPIAVENLKNMGTKITGLQQEMAVLSEEKTKNESDSANLNRQLEEWKEKCAEIKAIKESQDELIKKHEKVRKNKPEMKSCKTNTDNSLLRRNSSATRLEEMVGLHRSLSAVDSELTSPSAETNGINVSQLSTTYQSNVDAMKHLTKSILFKTKRLKVDYCDKTQRIIELEEQLRQSGQQSERLLKLKTDMMTKMTSRLDEIQDKLNEVESTFDNSLAVRLKKLDRIHVPGEQRKSEDEQVDHLTALATDLMDKAKCRNEQYLHLLTRTTDVQKKMSQVNEQLHNKCDRINQLDIEMKRLKGKVNDLDDSNTKLSATAAELHAKMHTLESKLQEQDNLLKKQNHQVEILNNRNRDYESNKERLQLENEDLDRKNQRLVQQLVDLENILSGNSTKADRSLEEKREWQESTAKLHSLIKELTAKLEQVEAKLVQERSERKKLAAAHTELQDEYALVKSRLAKSDRQLAAVQLLIREKEADLQRERDQQELMRSGHEQTLNDLKGRHAVIVAQLQDKCELLHRTAVKAESEVQRLRAQMYTGSEEVAAPARRISRTSSDVLAKMQDHVESKQNATGPLSPMMQQRGLDVVSRQMSELEREKQALISEKRVMRREIDEYIRNLADKTQEAAQLQNKNTSVHAEVARLEQHLADERSSKNELNRRLRQIQAEAAQRDSKAQQQIIEREADLDAERMAAHVKTTNAWVEVERIKAKLSATEKQLLADIEQAKQETAIAQQTIRELHFQQEAKARQSAQLLEESKRRMNRTVEQSQ